MEMNRRIQRERKREREREKERKRERERQRQREKREETVVHSFRSFGLFIPESQLGSSRRR